MSYVGLSYGYKSHYDRCFIFDSIAVVFHKCVIAFVYFSTKLSATNVMFIFITYCFCFTL